MTEETIMLLKLLLAQEEKEEPAKTAKRHQAKISEGLDIDPALITEKGEKRDHIQAEYLETDVTQDMRDNYVSHEQLMGRTTRKEVPIWEKYALSKPEAAEYFHIGVRALTKIINSDKYAEYLICCSNTS